jgi:hypothetical protein
MTIDIELASIYDVEAQIESDAHGRARERKHLSEKSSTNLEKSPHPRQGSISLQVDFMIQSFYAISHVEMLKFDRT